MKAPPPQPTRPTQPNSKPNRPSASPGVDRESFCGAQAPLPGHPQQNIAERPRPDEGLSPAGAAARPPTFLSAVAAHGRTPLP